MAREGVEDGPERLRGILEAIDRENSSDPTIVEYRGESIPLALAEGRVAYRWVRRLREDDPRGCPESLLIAGRGHHIRRWETPRSRFPEGRKGYLAWRRHLYEVHAGHLSRLMREYGYTGSDLRALERIVHKRRIKSDPDVQSYEDAVALTFLEIQFAPFAERTGRELLLRALRRTWRKMSPEGREAALSLAFPPKLERLLGEAVEEDEG